MQIECERFLLRLYKPQDKHSLQRHINKKKICEALSRVPYPYTLDDAEQFVLGSIEEYRKNHPPYTFTIDINGHTVGGIGLNEISHNQGELGYWLAEKYWNKGIMTEAIAVFTDYCFHEIELQRIHAKVYCSNKPSIKVLEKCGYRKESIVREKGKKFDSFIYANYIDSNY